MKSEAEIGVALPEAKARLEPPGAGGGRKGCPWEPQREHHPTDAMISDLQPLEMGENTLL